MFWPINQNAPHHLIYRAAELLSVAEAWRGFVHVTDLCGYTKNNLWTWIIPKDPPSVFDPWPPVCWKSRGPHSRLLTCQQLLHLNEVVVFHFPWAPASTGAALCSLRPRPVSASIWAASQPDGPPGVFFGVGGVLKVQLEIWELPRVSSPRGSQERKRRTPWGAVVAGVPWPSSVACSWWVLRLQLIL